MAATRPVIRLKPKGQAKAIRHGFPWAYDDEVVTDRRTKALAPGTLAVLEDAERQPLGLFTVNPASRIFARLLDRDPAAEIDETWLNVRFAAALALRSQLYDAPYYRLIHAEGDGMPGLIVDRFGDALVVQPNCVWADQNADTIAAVLMNLTGAGTVILNGSGRSRRAEGLDERVTLLTGRSDAPVSVPMNGATYFADLLGGQKTGLFFDQRDNHAFAARLTAPGAQVLDVFCHVGGFALACLAAGAGQALAVDASEPALALARRGAGAMTVADRLTTQRGDAFEVLAGLVQAQRRFDIVICDPPAFAPSRTALEQGLRAYERLARLAAPLVAPGGYLVLCSCSHAAGLDKFRSACLRGIGRAGRQAQLLRTGFAGPDHPLHPQLSDSGYLKALFFRLD